MPSVCFYFEVHQPYRLKPYGVMQVGRDHDYFDEILNQEVMRKVARKCYLPANRTILDLIERTEGRFRVAYGITGVFVEQAKRYAPEVLDSFESLARSGGVEFIAETYYHSLAALYDPGEFREQVAQQTAMVERHFGQTPTTFRNTELIYNDNIGAMIEQMGFDCALVEGADDILRWQSPNHVYRLPGSELRLLTKNYKLSDDVAFRFSNRAWPDYPLTADKFTRWIHDHSGAAEVINLFMDYETFGEHQWSETGIFEFLQCLPEQLLAKQDWDFLTPSEVIARYPARAELSYGRDVSWADEARDLSAWRGNTMQHRALHELYTLGQEVAARNNPHLLSLWRKLQTSDHYYYMATKSAADAEVHDYFSPYEGPYDAFIHFMNVLKDLRRSILAQETRLNP